MIHVDCADASILVLGRAALSTRAYHICLASILLWALTERMQKKNWAVAPLLSRQLSLASILRLGLNVT